MEIPQKLKDYIDSNRLPLLRLKDEDEPLQIDFSLLFAFVHFGNRLRIRTKTRNSSRKNFETLRKLGS